MSEHHQPQQPTRYEASRSGTDRNIHIICGEDRFYDLPHEILHLGPWQGLDRGDVQKLKPAYRALLAEQGFVLVYQRPLLFEPEVT